MLERGKVISYRISTFAGELAAESGGRVHFHLYDMCLDASKLEDEEPSKAPLTISTAKLRKPRIGEEIIFKRLVRPAGDSKAEVWSYAH